jgi:hypothetical protein
MTQRTASITFDFPQPLGPTTAQRDPGTVTVVGSANDLKPASLICFRRINSRQITGKFDLSATIQPALAPR